MSEALYHYKGVQYNPSGAADENSLFSGVSYVDDVNIEKEIIAHMKDVVMTRYYRNGSASRCKYGNYSTV